MHLLLILRREHVREVGLPVTLEELGTGKVTDEQLMEVAKAADAYGRYYLGEDFSSLYKYVKFHQEFPQILDSLRPKSGRP